MDKEAFRMALATVEAHVGATGDLLDALNRDQLTFTAKGARDTYKQYFPKDEGLCAIHWMDEHYDSISASVGAAVLLMEAAKNLVEPLWSIAGELIKEEKEAPANA